MRLFGFNITRARAEEKALSAIPQRGWWRLISEPFTGAWQRNLSETQQDLTCYPALYSCISFIARDIAKCPFVLKSKGPDGIWNEIENPAYSPVLRKPNHYQTAQQFREAWQLSKLTQGNAYILKQRDDRGVVVKLYVLDPCRVLPLVSESGDVFYQLQPDNLNLLSDTGGMIVVPARDIIHDREITVHHPLIGVPPLCAAYWPAVKNLKLLRSAAEFFANGAAPGGILEVPGAVSDEIVTDLARRWQENFTGSNAGKVAVIADGMKYNQLKASNSDSQLVEQMKYSDEQVCQAFGIPPYKLGLSAVPAGWKSDDVNIEYHSNALSSRIEHMENLLDEGLNIARPAGVEMDLSPLWRMDAGKQAEVEAALVGGTIKTPNEARRAFNLGSKTGGDALYLQQQNYSLEALAKRDAQADPFGTRGNAPAEPEPEPDMTDKASFLLWRKSPETYSHV